MFTAANMPSFYLAQAALRLWITVPKVWREDTQDGQ